MHSMTINHTTTERVSRRGMRDSQVARQLSSVTPCLHPMISREYSDR